MVIRTLKTKKREEFKRFCSTINRFTSMYGKQNMYRIQ